MFQNSDEAITIELKLYIEEWEKLQIKKKSQVSKAIFLAKYGSLALYDEYLEEIFTIDHEQLKSDKNAGWTLIGIPEKEDETLFDYEYFYIHDDLFDIIQSTRQGRNILWKLDSY